ncbi:hypothetical protein [Glycomyces tritici]|uniref:Restriction endonuclease n=1 Tax=Glycomyces tritici TaxID=2665176 RepID=A0ABT7YW88_9ACTN|nr:hypothetical protein [Glycomyces tritici]MDN3240882.1 hypothetical protein [Glycomyces tritici]MDN3242915.1 hypothetical protein [Glycomyces tritici]
MEWDVSELLEEAERIVVQVEAMVESPGDPDEDSKRLRELYSPWKAAAVRYLSDEQRKRFDAEYTGSMMFPKIRRCLEGIDKRPGVSRTQKSLESISGSWHEQLPARFVNPIREQCDILRELDDFQVLRPEKTLSQLEAMGRRLPEVFRELREQTRRHDAWVMKNEYDVQDVLSLILKGQFDDVRDEESAPSFAGSGYRMDFWLKKERIAIEVKMTRQGLSAKKLRDELLVDIVQYQKFPEAKGLFIYVYDPTHRVGNTTAFETDLNQADARFPIRTVVGRLGRFGTSN